MIFLSLVAAPSELRRIGTLSSDKDLRRFNVAASRARDQMWLFHTATLNELNPNCMRHRLLEYCLHPEVEPTSFDGIALEDDEVVAPFESLFEQQVFRKIQARGYRVLPQVNVAGYRIDLVVEGMRGRLAVECDGERWHGPEQYDADMARQRDLERCGWTFWRVRGGAFYRDPDAAMAGLWETLDRLNIHPSAVDAASTRPIPASDILIPKGPLPMGEAELASADSMPRPASSSPFDAGSLATVSTNERIAPPTPGQNGSSEDETMLLRPYLSWHMHPLPHPLTAGLEEIVDGLVEIVAAEGPMPCRRAYRLYAEAAGADAREARLRSVFNKAAYRAIQQGRLDEHREHDTPGQIDNIVRISGTPAVVVRERGDRALNEIPRSEIAAALAAVANSMRCLPTAEPEELFQHLLPLYGLERSPDSEWQTRILHEALEVAGIASKQE